MDEKRPVRKPLRLNDYDYSSPGAYFITFCTYNRKRTLSRIVGAIHESPATQLTPCGSIVDTVMNNIPEHLGVTIDRYVIMPNHVHLIALIKEEAAMREIHESPPTRSFEYFKIDWLYQNKRLQIDPKTLRRC